MKVKKLKIVFGYPLRENTIKHITFQSYFDDFSFLTPIDSISFNMDVNDEGPFIKTYLSQSEIKKLIKVLESGLDKKRGVR